MPTDPAGLIEDVIPPQDNVFEALNIYRHLLGLPEMTRSQFQVLPGGDPSGTLSGENTLDFSVVSGVFPLSAQYIYSMLGGTVFNAYQQAFFGTTHHVNVVSSSFGLHFEPTANSPFAWVYRQLFVDGALANVTVSMAGGDQAERRHRKLPGVADTGLRARRRWHLAREPACGDGRSDAGQPGLARPAGRPRHRLRPGPVRPDDAAEPPR